MEVLAEESPYNETLLEKQKQKTEKAPLKLMSHGHTSYTPEPKSPQNRVQ